MAHLCGHGPIPDCDRSAGEGEGLRNDEAVLDSVAHLCTVAVRNDVGGLVP